MFSPAPGVSDRSPSPSRLCVTMGTELQGGPPPQTFGFGVSTSGCQPHMPSRKQISSVSSKRDFGIVCFFFFFFFCLWFSKCQGDNFILLSQKWKSKHIYFTRNFCALDEREPGVLAIKKGTLQWAHYRMTCALAGLTFWWYTTRIFGLSFMSHPLIPSRRAQLDVCLFTLALTPANLGAIEPCTKPGAWSLGQGAMSS
jgi:hypothetical protein